MSSSEPPTEQVSCDLCGANDWELLLIGQDRRHRTLGEFGVTKCRRCGHLQTNPRPTCDAVQIYYPQNYSAHSLSCARVSRSIRDLKLLEIARRSGLWDKLLLPIATYRFHRIVPSWLSKEQGLLLEIGCGMGWFCGLAVEMGWQPVGLDISANACWEAKRMWDINVVCSDSLPLPFKSQTFPLVVLRHTLEHLFSPKQVLREVYRVLKGGGWIALEVPNANSLGRKVFGGKWDTWELPRHLHHFTPKTLRRFLEIAGFHNIRISSGVYKPFTLTTFWLPRRSLAAAPLRLVLGLPTWALLPLLIFCQQGEILRAWGQKPVSLKT